MKRIPVSLAALPLTAVICAPRILGAVQVLETPLRRDAVA